LIQVRIQNEASILIIEIEDNGSGISAQNIDQVFEPKFTTKTGGMGLGLAIVKNSIDSLNGSITYKTQQYKGTTFIIQLKKEA
jgi:C4-dicarboxylate-specific signal transduction histidine kinase